MNGKSPSMLQDGYYLVAKIVNGVVQPISAMQQIKDSTPKRERREVWLNIGSVAAEWGCTVKDLYRVSLLPEYTQFFTQERGKWFVRDDFVMPTKKEIEEATSLDTRHNWISIPAFAKKTGLAESAIRNRQHRGGWNAYFRHVGKAVKVREDMPVTTPRSGGPISVICKETGETYKSINAACRSAGLTYAEIKKSLKTGKKCGGFHFTYAT